MNLNTLTPYFKVIADAQSRALDGTCYVVRGLAPTANGAGLRVDVAAGDSVEAGTPHNNYAGGNVTCTAASSAASLLYRRDIVYRSSAGTLTVTAGTAALLTSTTPVPPALPASATLISVVFIAPGQTTLTAADVEDVRQTRRNDVQALNVKVFGATGDGVTDDTAAIQAAITAAPSAGGVVFFPVGIYVISTTLTVPSNVTLWGSSADRGEDWNNTGKGSVLKNTTAATNTITITGPVNTVTIKNLTFEGSSTGDHILLTSSGAANVYFVTIQGCGFQGKARAIHAVYNTFQVYIRDNFIRDTTAEGIYIDASTGAGDTSIFIEYNWIKTAGTHGIRVGGVSGATDVVISGNAVSNITTAAARGILIDSAVSGFQILNNDIETLSGAGAYAIYMTGYNATISGNAIYDCVGGIYSNSCAYNFIGPNRGLKGASGAGTEFVTLDAISEQCVVMPQNTDWAAQVLNSGVRNIIMGRALGQIATGGQIYPGSGVTVGVQQTVAGLLGGTGVPTNGVGNNGDFYLRSDGGAGTCLYQRRGGVWVATGA